MAEAARSSRLRRPGRLVAIALAAAALALPARADAPPAPEPPRSLPPPSAPPAGADRVEVHLRFEPWALSGRFRVASSSGELSDEGIARDDAGLSSLRPFERVLEGSRGTLVLRLEAGHKTPGLPPFLGRWSVVRGTGAYARLAGYGTFTTCSSGGGDALKGSPFEVQTLVGYLHPK